MMGATKLNSLSDQELLSRIEGGDTMAYQEIFNRYWKNLYSYAFNILKEKTLTEDTVQEVFINVWQNRGKTDITSLGSYLIVATRNGAFKKLRDEHLTIQHVEVLEHILWHRELEDGHGYTELEYVIELASKELPERRREIFHLSRIENYSITEIAKKLNISKRTVENQLHLALKHIRGKIRNSELLLILATLLRM